MAYQDSDIGIPPQTAGKIDLSTFNYMGSEQRFILHFFNLDTDKKRG